MLPGVSRPVNVEMRRIRCRPQIMKMIRGRSWEPERQTAPVRPQRRDEAASFPRASPAGFFSRMARRKREPSVCSSNSRDHTLTTTPSPPLRGRGGGERWYDGWAVPPELSFRELACIKPHHHPLPLKRGKGVVGADDERRLRTPWSMQKDKSAREGWGLRWKPPAADPDLVPSWRRPVLPARG